MTPETIEHGSTLKKGKHESTDAFLKRVTHVSLVSKGIKVMEGLELCRNLSVLYLYENEICRIEGLWSCANLTRLYLQNNCIEEISEDCFLGLEKLNELHLSGNKLKFITGLTHLKSLEILHVDNQRCEESLIFDRASMDSVGVWPTLRCLTTSGNKIRSIRSLSGLVALESLDASKNNLQSWELISLNCASNPISNTLKFRQKAILMSACLENLNEKPISTIEREFLYNMDTVKKQRAKKQKGVTKPLDANGQQIFELTMVGNLDEKPIPHLPPYATQYRDLMLHQIAMSNLNAKSGVEKAKFLDGQLKAARAAESAKLLQENQEDDSEIIQENDDPHSSAESVFGSTVGSEVN
ncbi:hypothetical protein HDU82_000500 [Entophlyctis luteolus]|nr:hypothetical protein HDU82_000500 [Entophlyctis luteolus]